MRGRAIVSIAIVRVRWRAIVSIAIVGVRWCAAGDLTVTPTLTLTLTLTLNPNPKVRGKRSGYPHLCGQSHPCGKNDDLQPQL